MAIQDSRIEEQAQTKVEASEKFPISLTGMALFNVVSQLAAGRRRRISHSGSADLRPRDRGRYLAADRDWPRITTARRRFSAERFTARSIWTSSPAASTSTLPFACAREAINLDWKTRSIMVGIDKPIFNPREPSSLAQVGISPLTGAGNLWLWIPQARVEQDFAFNGSTGLRARTGVVETHEASPYNTSATSVTVAAARPGIEGRYEFYHKFDEDRRIEIATGFHASTTHAGGFSIPSRVLSFDWLFKPDKRVELTGVFFTGQNVANLGTGAINDGYAIYRRDAFAIAAPRRMVAVYSSYNSPPGLTSL